MNAPTRPALRYHGGKWRLAPWIIGNFPPHRTYVEPYGGAASVLLRKRRCYAEVYNDLDSEIVNVFRVLRDTVEALAQLCRCKPEDMRRALVELRAKKAADVTRNGSGTWTLVNRRMKREADARNAAADRVKKHRKSRALSECNADGDSGAAQRKPLPGFEDATLPTAETETRNAAETPERLRVKELTPLPPKARGVIPQDLIDLHDFLREATGYGQGVESLARIVHAGTSQDVLTAAVEARVAFGVKAFDGLMHADQALAADCRRDPKGTGAFPRWNYRRNQRTEHDQRRALRETFQHRPKAERASLVAAFLAAGHGLTCDEQLSQLSAQEIGALCAGAEGSPLAIEAACVERWARAQRAQAEPSEVTRG
jgi:hypothetical protein